MSLHIIIDPSTPNFLRVQDILSQFERQYLPPYKVGAMGGDVHETLMLAPWQKFVPCGEERLEWDNNGAAGCRFWYWAGLTTAFHLGLWLATSPIYYDWREANPHLKDGLEDLVNKTVQELTECIGTRGLVLGCMIQPVLHKNYEHRHDDFVMDEECLRSLEQCSSKTEGSSCSSKVEGSSCSSKAESSPCSSKAECSPS